MPKMISPLTGKQIEDYTGRVFNQWTIIGIDLDSDPAKLKWLCQCKCGTVASRYISAIKDGKSKSCGCLSERTPDLVGQRFGRLQVLEMHRVSEPKSKIFWTCKCDCGNEVDVETVNLVHGSTKSCGCYRRDYMAKVACRHGYGRERIYKNFLNMHQRCENPNDNQFARYGARGITVCDQWKDFVVFYDWAISNGYQCGLTLDRIDVNGPYAPWNCRWATAFQQGNNRRNTIYITLNGVTKTISEWALTLDIPRQRIYIRHKRGLPPEQILSKE